MRILLSALIALSAPMSSSAAVVERMPTLGFGAPAALAAAPVLTSPMSSLMPGAVPASFLAVAVAPMPAPALAAAPVLAARGGLAALGSALIREAKPADAAAAAPARSAALDWTFERTAAASDGPLPVLGAPSPERPAALKPAARAPSRWRAAVPNLLTYSNMASGLAAAFLASEGKIAPAALGIIAAVVFDALDGRAARALGVKNPLGIDMDSLADIVAFGAAPALLIFKAALLPVVGWWGFPIAAAFAAAGLFRLARFNVGAHVEKTGAAPVKASDSFTGLPIPGGAGVIVALSLALASIPAAWIAPVAAAVALLTAGAMVSRLPYPAFKKGGAKALIAPAAVGALAVAPLLALKLYSFIPAAVFGLYLAAGPMAALFRRLR
ncbi:MAG: CDP-alcohol phosphatidyltransferase family protein [Elusimicrobiota bacterium]